MKSHFCMPTRMRASRKSTTLSPMSLLDRFREAVFRLIMISALSRASNSSAATAYSSTSTYDSQSPIRLSSRSSSKSSPAATSRHHHHHRSYHHYASDSHHTEAVADCIEFIKRSANDEIRDSSGSSSSRSPVYDNSSEIVIPLPVM